MSNQQGTQDKPLIDPLFGRFCDYLGELLQAAENDRNAQIRAVVREEVAAAMADREERTKPDPEMVARMDALLIATAARIDDANQPVTLEMLIANNQAGNEQTAIQLETLRRLRELDQSGEQPLAS